MIYYYKYNVNALGDFRKKKLDPRFFTANVTNDLLDVIPK